MTAYIIELIGGPQDGGKIQINGPPPAIVYVGPKPLDDGFCAWGRELSPQFPCQYDYFLMSHDYRFVLTG